MIEQRWFQVADGCQLGFLDTYGPGGGWERLFGKDENYLRTIVSHKYFDGDPERVFIYLTLDFWTSKSAYESFKQKYAEEYKEVDRLCEEMMEKETFIGAFEQF